MREKVSEVALIEIRAEDVQRVKDHLASEDFVVARYELLGRYNLGVIVEVKDQKILFDVVILNIRKIPGVLETRTHLIHDGVVL
jgi:DNA-binding Lrp family transcriptional regulator